MCSAILFLLPREKAKIEAIQTRFLVEGSFWEPFLARLHLWAKPLGVSRTETPDKEPALILLLEACDQEDLLKQIGHEIAESLEIPAFAVSFVELDGEMQRELVESPKPWLSEASATHVEV
jgi:hypothetical protein